MKKSTTTVRKSKLIEFFLKRHSLSSEEYYPIAELGYNRAKTMCMQSDPMFGKYAYWLMRHELYLYQH